MYDSIHFHFKFKHRRYRSDRNTVFT